MYLPIGKDTISSVTSNSVEGLSTKMYAFAGEHLSQVLFVFFMLVCYIVAGCDRWFELRARDRERLRLRELHRVPPTSYGTTTPSTTNTTIPTCRSEDRKPTEIRKEILVRQKPVIPKAKNLSPLPVRPLPSSHVSA